MFIFKWSSTVFSIYFTLLLFTFIAFEDFNYVILFINVPNGQKALHLFKVHILFCFYSLFVLNNLIYIFTLIVLFYILVLYCMVVKLSICLTKHMITVHFGNANKFFKK